MKLQKILVLTVIVGVAIVIGRPIVESAGENQALKEKYQMLLAVSCQQPDLQAQLEELDIPSDWVLATVIESKPELYKQIVQNIVAECSDVQL